MVSRYLFLCVASLIAFAVGGVALFFPSGLLATKGISNNPAAQVWMQEVGALLLAVGYVAWRIRSHHDSATLKAVLLGNALLQVILMPIEVVAYLQGVIPALLGILPNTVLHGALAVGFAVHALGVQASKPEARLHSA